MKKLFLTLAAILAIAPALVSCDKEDKLIGENELPARAAEFIKEHFSGIKISAIMLDRDLFEKTYEVFLADGSNLDFDKNGDWTDIECHSTAVPGNIVPEKIRSYVTSNHASRQIVGIDRDKHDYELELDNGLDLKFDLNFNIIGYDN